MNPVEEKFILKFLMFGFMRMEMFSIWYCTNGPFSLEIMVIFEEQNLFHKEI